MKKKKSNQDWLNQILLILLLVRHDNKQTNKQIYYNRFWKLPGNNALFRSLNFTSSLPKYFLCSGRCTSAITSAAPLQPAGTFLGSFSSTSCTPAFMVGNLLLRVSLLLSNLLFLYYTHLCPCTWVCRTQLVLRLICCCCSHRPRNWEGSAPCVVWHFHQGPSPSLGIAPQSTAAHLRGAGTPLEGQKGDSRHRSPPPALLPAFRTELRDQSVRELVPCAPTAFPEISPIWGEGCVPVRLGWGWIRMCSRHFSNACDNPGDRFRMSPKCALSHRSLKYTAWIITL